MPPRLFLWLAALANELPAFADSHKNCLAQGFIVFFLGKVTVDVFMHVRQTEKTWCDSVVLSACLTVHMISGVGWVFPSTWLNCQRMLPLLLLPSCRCHKADQCLSYLKLVTEPSFSHRKPPKCSSEILQDRDYSSVLLHGWINPCFWCCDSSESFSYVPQGRYTQMQERRKSYCIHNILPM